MTQTKFLQGPSELSGTFIGRFLLDAKDRSTYLCVRTGNATDMLKILRSITKTDASGLPGSRYFCICDPNWAVRKG